eukprot:snap_masked-scaffold_4-processed-gene-7.31-mRNA-1 protein AED:1.00 eAED:1.00 QI:0/-1/0/0/-1/1/1/0/460
MKEEIVHWKVFEDFVENGNVPQSFKQINPWFFQDFSTIPNSPICFLQNENGPCGLLSFVNATLIANRLIKNGSVDIDKGFSNDEFAIAFVQIIERVCPGEDKVKLALWKDADGAFGKDDLVFEQTDKREMKSFFDLNITAYMNYGCLILLTYSIYASSVENFPRSFVSNVTDFNFCEEPLMEALYHGKPGFLYQYNELREAIDAPADIQNQTRLVGLLSYLDTEGRPIHTTLKNSQTGVYVIHGVNHYTILFPASSENTEVRDFYHFNGLRKVQEENQGLTAMKLKLNEVINPKIKYEATRRIAKIPKPAMGDIDTFMRTDKSADKHDPRKWRFEVLLYNEKRLNRFLAENKDRIDESIQTSGNILKQIETPGANWYCQSCTDPISFEYVMNQAEDQDCKKCGKIKAEAGYSFYVSFDDLPSGWKASTLNANTKLIIRVLRTKWSTLEVLEPEPAKQPVI